ncbi:MAG: cryptochrome/photolyase family protein [Rhodospirillales bacterium]
MTLTLVPVLGDQLTIGLASLRAADPASAIVLFAEVSEEASYVPHHKKKIAFAFSSMRHFADTLRRDGWTVDYVRFEDPANTGTLAGEIRRSITQNDIDRIVITEPGEWRLRTALEEMADAMTIPVEILEDDRFIASHADFDDWADGRKQLRLEHFYREMRVKTGLLMTADGQPEGGRWNFDADNRQPANPDLFMPRPMQFTPDGVTREVIELVQRHFGDHFGDLEPFWFGVTAEQAKRAFGHFVKTALPQFGDFQDAMISGHAFMFHSVASLYINAGLLDPIDACRRVEDAYRSGDVPLNAAEGFIRQIIGWREFVRGIYWREGPEYVSRNTLNHTRPLPTFFWTGDTDMACIRDVVEQTRAEAYAHHIQRLMITGNFALLAGVDPREVHEWYLAVYADAYEWVELPNTLGMSQFADGGLLASKPYVSSGNYINRMSDYCEGCRYDVKRKHGNGACPFNALYWHFIDRHAPELRRNPRLRTVYATWDRMSESNRLAYRSSATAFLKQLS